MNSKNDQLKQQVLTTLSGWKDPLAELRKLGTVTGAGDLTLDYYNQLGTRLSLEIHLSEQQIRAHILNAEEDAGPTLVIEAGEKLLDVIKIFHQHQDTVTNKKYLAFLKDILAIDVQLFTETHEGLVPFSWT